MSDWTHNEPGLARFIAELRRLRKRSRSHILRTLVITLLFTATVVVRQLRKPKKYHSTVVLSMLEDTVQAQKGPIPKNQLRTYIADVSLNRRHLLELIDEFGLYSRLMLLQKEELALKEFWTDLELEVYQNQFALETDDNVERTARVALTFAAEEPDIANAVIDRLTKLIFEFETKRRAAEATAGQIQYRTAIHAAEEIIDEHLTILARKNEELVLASETREPALQFEILRLGRRISLDYQRLEALQKARQALAVRVSVARTRRAPIQVVDRKYPPEYDPKLSKLGILAIIVFFGSLPLIAAGVAAFDSRLYDTNDIRRLGVEVLGHVPRFRGSTQGALHARRRG